MAPMPVSEIIAVFNKPIDPFKPSTDRRADLKAVFDLSVAVIFILVLGIFYSFVFNVKIC